MIPRFLFILPGANKLYHKNCNKQYLRNTIILQNLTAAILSFKRKGKDKIDVQDGEWLFFALSFKQKARYDRRRRAYAQRNLCRA